MFLDLVSNHYKYERVENYVSARQAYQEERQRKRDRLMKKQARFKEKQKENTETY